jgi:hypothetical protein
MAPVTRSRALYTTPYVPSPTRSSFSYCGRRRRRGGGRGRVKAGARPRGCGRLSGWPRPRGAHGGRGWGGCRWRGVRGGVPAAAAGAWRAAS